MLAGVVMICTLGVPSGLTTAQSVLSIVGIICCGFAFDTGYLFTKELFPTVLRTTALSVASSAARVGSILSPVIGNFDNSEIRLIGHRIIGQSA